MENRWDGSETEANHEMEIMTYILDSLCPEEQPDVRHPQLPNTKPLPSVESLGPPPPKPPRPPVVTLQAFQRQAAALSKPDGEGKETHTQALAQPAKGSHGSRAPVSLSPPPAASAPRGRCQTAFLWGWTSFTAYSHIEAVAACP